MTFTYLRLTGDAALTASDFDVYEGPCGGHYFELRGETTEDGVWLAKEICPAKAFETFVFRGVAAVLPRDYAPVEAPVIDDDEPADAGSTIPKWCGTDAVEAPGYVDAKVSGDSAAAAIRQGIVGTGPRPTMTRIVSAAIAAGATDGEALWIARTLGVRCKPSDVRYRRARWAQYGMVERPPCNAAIIEANGWLEDVPVDAAPQPTEVRRRW